MEVPWQNWLSDLDMDETGLFNNQSQHKTYSFDDDDDELLKEIFRQPCFSSESDSTHSSPIQNNAVTTASDGGGSAAATTPTTTISSLLPLDIDSGGSASQVKPNGSSSSILSILGTFSDNKTAVATSSPSTYMLSFDNSTVLRATSGEGYRRHESTLKSNNQEKLESSTGGGGTRTSQKRTLERHNSGNHKPKANNQGTKRTRNSSETLDHIMAERKRRQELTEKFIALSATIPGLKKIDKASILSEAIIHVKQLQERVKELEEQNRKMMNSTVESSLSYKMKKNKTTKKKSSLLSSSNNNDDDDQETNSDIDDYYFRINEELPEVEARVLHRQVLIRIHCENQKGIILKLLAQLHRLHFTIITHNALPFGNSILDITLIAEVDEEHSIPMKELVKKLRMTLLKKSVD